MIAAVTKLMSNMDLIVAAKKIEVRAHCNTTIGGYDTLAVRLQPNHTTDDPDGIMISTLEGKVTDFPFTTFTTKKQYKLNKIKNDFIVSLVLNVTKIAI